MITSKLKIFLFLAYFSIAIFAGILFLYFQKMQRERQLQFGINEYKVGKYQLAVEHITPYARNGNTSAQKLLGEIYALGLGVPVDEVQALIWFRRAQCTCNDQGRDEYDIAFEYMGGFVIKKDSTQAVKWLMHAAQAGNTNAQKLLADEKQLNSKGLIVDPIISKYWVKFLNNEHQDIPMAWSLSPDCLDDCVRDRINNGTRCNYNILLSDCHDWANANLQYCINKCKK